MNSKHILSKSTFMYGHQCPKRLYLHKFAPELRNPMTEAQQNVFAAGTNAGILAQDLFPGGVNAEPETPYEFHISVQKTKEYIEAGHTIIYEATFNFEGVLCAIDLLVKQEDGWHAFEVKSTNGVKDPHVKDASLQYYVMSNCGLDIKNISIVHFNKQYVKRGDIDVQTLFSKSTVLEPVLNFQELISSKAKELKELVMNRIEPQIDPGPHCSKPYECDFSNHCWKNVVPPPPKDFGEEKINPAALKDFMESLEYPLYFFDFETVAYGVPEYDESRPYQAVPFQFSLHVIDHLGATVRHIEFLGNGIDDPRPELINSMIENMGTTGSILVWYKPFEYSKTGQLAVDFPQYADKLFAIQSRLVDLMVPFKQGHYRHPEMKGSSSIKKVLPVLIPELSYDDLNIGEGGTASLTYSQLPSMDSETREQKIKDLLEYCKQDTWAMVRIWEWIGERIND
jgi:hypothetical protein